eukprot:4041182-Amphidinium_carterae.1
MKGRLRQAWELANAEFAAVTSHRAEGKGEDIEEPLDPSDQQAQETLFVSIHNSLRSLIQGIREFKKGSSASSWFHLLTDDASPHLHGKCT